MKMIRRFAPDRPSRDAMTKTVPMIDGRRRPKIFLQSGHTRADLFALLVGREYTDVEVREILPSLPAEELDVLQMVMEKNKRLVDIAVVLGRKQPAISARLYSAIDRIKWRLARPLPSPRTGMSEKYTAIDKKIIALMKSGMTKQGEMASALGMDQARVSQHCTRMVNPWRQEDYFKSYFVKGNGPPRA